MEDYEKKYKEALSRAATELETCGADKSLRNMIYAIFPDELKESEDERIRKALVRFHKSTIDIDGIKGADILAWIEKQGEQKPDDKVEPKFHKGEWIVWKNKCYKVNYNGCGYELIDQNGLSTWLEYGTVDTSARLYDVAKDAKDGDVVVDKSDGTIGIFESIGHHPDGGSFNDPSYCFLHCRYDDGYFFADFEDGNMMTSDDVIPAIKEQSDILFTEMKEAGYEWSDKDRKLIKIVRRV